MRKSLQYIVFVSCFLLSPGLSAQKITRFAVCKSVKQLEPTGITNKFEKGERAYVWMRVEEAEVGSQIFVDWYQADELQHTSKLTLKYASMRTYTYKTLYASGIWKAVVRNSGGKILKKVELVSGDVANSSIVELTEILEDKNSNPDKQKKDQISQKKKDKAESGTLKSTVNKSSRKPVFSGKLIADEDSKLEEVYKLEDCTNGKTVYIKPNGQIIIRAISNYEPSEGMIRFSEYPDEDDTIKYFKYAFVSTDGKTRTQWYHNATDFGNGLAAVQFEKDKLRTISRTTAKINDNWMFINRKGEQAFPKKYNSARGFKNGRAAVKVFDGVRFRWGFIDTKGKMVIEPKYGWVEDFNKTYAPFESRSKHGLLDRDGNVVLEPNYDGVHVYDGGAIWVMNESVKWALIGENFKQVSDFIYGWRGDLYHGAVVAKRTDDTRMHDILDQKGNVLAKAKYIVNRDFKEGFTLISDDNINWSCILPNGKITWTKKIGRKPRIVNGKILGGYEKNGVLNIQGDWIIEPKYNQIEQAEGELTYRISYRYNVWGLIDETGKTLIEPQFPRLGPAVEGLVLAGDWTTGINTRATAFYNLKGEKVIDVDYPYATTFKNGLAAIAKYTVDETDPSWEKCYYINKKGEIFWESKRDALESARFLLPPDYNPATKYPVLVSMPFTGGGAGIHLTPYLNFSDDLEKQRIDFGKFLEKVFPDENKRKKNQFIVLLTAGGGTTRDHSAEGFSAAINRYDLHIKSELDRLASIANIDRSRIYLTGYSLGGDLSWALTHKNAGMYKGAVIAGTRCGYPIGDITKLKETDARFYMVIGGHEDNVRLRGMDNAKSLLQQKGIPFQHHVIPEKGHIQLPRNNFLEGLRYVMEER